MKNGPPCIFFCSILDCSRRNEADVSSCKDNTCELLMKVFLCAVTQKLKYAGSVQTFCALKNWKRPYCLRWCLTFDHLVDVLYPYSICPDHRKHHPDLMWAAGDDPPWVISNPLSSKYSHLPVMLYLFTCHCLHLYLDLSLYASVS